jgi:competence transcription factor ComK
MKYKSETMTITNEAELSDELDEQIMRLKDALASLLTKENIRLDVALSVFATMYARTACDYMELPKELALEAITQTLEMHYADDGYNKGEMQWLN